MINAHGCGSHIILFLIFSILTLRSTTYVLANADFYLHLCFTCSRLFTRSG